MKITHKLLVTPLLITALHGCATGPAFKDIKAVEGTGTLFIYRPSMFTAAAIAPHIYINDRRFINLINGGYSYLSVNPGIIHIESRSNRTWDAPNKKVTINVSSGKKYYIKISPYFHEDSNFTLYYVKLESDMINAGTVTGSQEIKECNLIEPEWIIETTEEDEDI